MIRWTEGYPIRVSEEQAADMLVHHLLLAAMFFNSLDTDSDYLALSKLDENPDHIAKASKAFISSLSKHYEGLL